MLEFNTYERKHFCKKRFVLLELYELVLLKKHGTLEHREEILKLIDEINELNIKFIIILISSCVGRRAFLS